MFLKKKFLIGSKQVFLSLPVEKRNHNKYIFVSWQNSRGDIGQIFVDTLGEFLGEFSWTFLVNFPGHFFNSND